MKRLARAALCVAVLSCSSAFAADVTTFLKATPDTATARQVYGAKLTYHFDAAPTAKNCILHVTILDKAGKEVGGGLVQPSKTTDWKGNVDLTRWVGLPDMPPSYGKTHEPLPDGTYTVWLKFQPEEGGDEPGKAGPGVKENPQFGFQVATLKLDHTAPIPTLGPKTLDLTGYHKTWSEDFDTLSVNAAGPCGTGPGEAHWMAHTPSHGDFGDAQFVDPKPGFPFTTKNGILSIHVKKTDQGWKGGLLSSVDYKGNGFFQKFGYFEMSAKLAKGTGTWPAFWLLSQPDVGKEGESDTMGSEIDVLEQYGHWPNILNTTTHQWPHNKTNKHTATFEGFVVPGMTDGFHTYGVMITEEKLTYYYDGVELRHEKTPDSAKVPMYVLVNFTLGPGWPLDKTPTDMAMQVDYIHVYSK